MCKILLAKILTHVKLNKNLKEGRIHPEESFRQGCLSFFISDVLGGQQPKIVEAKRVMELLKFFLDLQCDKKFAFIATQISNMACINRAQKRFLGSRPVSSFVNFRKGHVELIAKNEYSRSFCKYLQRDLNFYLFNSKCG